jgi:hypothetical protein
VGLEKIHHCSRKTIRSMSLHRHRLMERTA